MILVLYVDDILLVANDVAMLHVKKYLSNNFKLKDMGLLELSQKGYIN